MSLTRGTPLKSLMSVRRTLTQDERETLQASRKRATKAELMSHLAKAARANAKSIKRPTLRPHTAPTLTSSKVHGGPLPPVRGGPSSSGPLLPPQMRANLEVARQRADVLLAKFEGANKKANAMDLEEEEQQQQQQQDISNHKKTNMMLSIMKEKSKPITRCSPASLTSSLDHRLRCAITTTTTTKKKKKVLSAPAAIPPFGKHRRRQEAKLKELATPSFKQPPMGFGGARKKFSVSKIVSSRQSNWKSLVGNAEVSHAKLLNHPGNRRAHMTFRHKGAASEYESFRLFRVNRGFKSLVGVSDTTSFASRH